MLAVFLAPIYLAVNIYILRWLIKWMGACHKHFKKKYMRVSVICVYLFFALSIGIAFFLPPSDFRRLLKLIGNYWLGVSLYVILTVVLVDMGRLILKRLKWVSREKLSSRRTFVAAGSVCAALIAAVSIYGAANARNIRTTSYEVTINKQAKDLSRMNIVLIADLHLGYNIGISHMKQMVEKINGMDADLIVIAGDIFDNEYEALESPGELSRILSEMKSTYGVYACYGNHDIEEKILAGFTFGGEKKKMSDPKMDEFLKKANIRLLHDEITLVDDSFYLVGRADYERPGRGIESRMTPEEITSTLDLSKPVIVIDHEPRELSELAKAGVDLDLCGHTHDGQLFPGNIVMDFLWENPYGYLQKGKMHNIVTSGVGLFGPNMRVGTKSEICLIEVTFASRNETP